MWIFIFVIIIKMYNCFIQYFIKANKKIFQLDSIVFNYSLLTFELFNQIK